MNHEGQPRGGETFDPGAVDRRYQAVVQSIDEGFCVVEMIFDADGAAFDYRFLEANPAFARHTGLPDVVGRRMRELAPAHELFWFETYGRVARSGEPIRFMHHSEALQDRWFDVYAFRVDPPAQMHVAVLFTDITERVRTERDASLLGAISQELVRVTRVDDFAGTVGAKLADHLQLSACAFIQVAAGCRVARVIDSWAEHGSPARQREYDIGPLIDRGFWPEAREGRPLVVADVSQDPRFSGFPWFASVNAAGFLAVPLLLDGRLTHVMFLSRARPQPWRPGQVELVREVAARWWVRMENLRAETALRLSEERMRLVLENAREYSIFTADLERRVTSWNAGAERLLGYTEAEILGGSADIIFTEEDRANGVPEAEAGRALEQGRAVNERWHVRKDGTRFWGSGMVMSMQDRRGSVIGLLKIMRDQTAEEQARQALEQSRRALVRALETTELARAEAVAASRAKDQFLATLSHELRTPLNPVLMLASEAATDPTLSSDVRRDFEMIRRNVELEARLIDDILDVSRITQGKLPLRRVELHVHEELRQAVDNVRGAAELKGLTLDLHLGARHDRVVGDPARRQQIFLNLLNNAAKFTDAGGAIRISTENIGAPARVRIIMADTGIGIAAEELGTIFQPFAQGGHAGESGSPTFGGLGLGLAIVEELTVRHGGTILAESAGRGHGATFTVTLPLAGAPLSPADGPPRAADAGARRCSILLVEDHDHTRVTMERVLRMRGHEVVAAPTCAEARARVASRRFDVLIADLGLPDGDGYGLLRDLRIAQPHLAGIALSGFGMSGDLRRSQHAGYAAHLVKPVSASKLEQELARVVGTGRGGAATER